MDWVFGSARILGGSRVSPLTRRRALADRRRVGEVLEARDDDGHAASRLDLLDGVIVAGHHLHGRAQRADHLAVIGEGAEGRDELRDHAELHRRARRVWMRLVVVVVVVVVTRRS